MKKLFVLLMKNPFFQGGIFLTISSQIINFINYFFNFLTARALGPNGYGEIISLLSYLTIVSIPLSIVSSILTQKISSNEDKKFTVTRMLELWLWSKKKYFLSLLLVLFISIPFLPRITNLSLSSSIALVFLFTFAIIGIFYNTALQALHLFLAISVVAIIIALVKFSGGLLAWLNFGQVNTVVIFLVLSGATNFLLSFYIYKKGIKNQTKLSDIQPFKKKLTQIIKNEYLIITTLCIIASALIGNVDIVIVKKFASSFDAGIYSSWSLFAKIILYLISPFMSLSFIFFSSKKNLNKQNTVLNLSLIILVVVGLSCYLVYAFFPQLITDVLFGYKFKAVAPYLTQAAIFGTLYTSLLLLNNYFLAKKSRVSLVLPLLSPVYIIGLLIIKGNFQNTILLNIYISSLAVSIYLFYYLSKIYKRNSV